MSKLSLFKKEWIDMVFEGRNKKYGAYQLRSENPVTTIKALGLGVLLFVLLIGSGPIFGWVKGLSAAKEEKVELVELTELPEPEPEEILPPEPPKVEQKQAPKSIVEEIKFKPLEAAKKEEVPDEIPDTKDFKEADPSDKNAEASPDGDINIDKPSGDLNKGVEAEDNGIYASAGLQVQPTYPGGMDAFYKYVNNNFRIPEIEQNMVAKIYVSFVVEKDGSMTQIKILRDPGFNLGKEAERVLKSMKKKWEPGIQNGKPVRASYNLPITINIKS